MSDQPLLSRILFEARERVEMQIRSLELTTGKTDEWGRRLVEEIEGYRDAQGWTPNGYGGEDVRTVRQCDRPAPHGFHTYLIHRKEYACRGHA